MQELRPGLWTWTGRHPEWQEGRDTLWGPDVRSYAVDFGHRIVLFDPIDPPTEFLEGGDAEVVLTAEWHGRSAHGLDVPVHGYADPLPRGVVAYDAFYPEERVLWLPDHSALVCGDSLPDGGGVPDEWLGETPRNEYNAKLRPLLDLPIELLLPTHGDPRVDDAHAHLARALS